VQSFSSSTTGGVPDWHAPLAQPSAPLQASPSEQSEGTNSPRTQAFVAAPEQKATKSSSASASQSSSFPSQVASFDAGVPGAQLSCTEPLTQLVLPVAAHAPTPQFVLCEA
jgi:hypothetical protein